MDLSGSEGWAKSLIDKLNGNWKIDYGRILDEKRKFMDSLFDSVGRDKILEDADFNTYVKNNAEWLVPYAAFKVQLSKERTFNNQCNTAFKIQLSQERTFNNQWFDCTKWSKRVEDAAIITSLQGGDYDQVVRVYFTQYHLHVQLVEASRYLESKGVALKGDLPIGVTRCSQDVWAEPNLFKLDRNAGAPGDPEQNWGFPPYNWDQMHKDGCGWWRRRLHHMEQYFHAYR
ncbi:glycoside hydrolase [Baffinella frigidus]|nr:glycoside hydrolase [Cryptophyta sp. CCMP2293]